MQAPARLLAVAPVPILSLTDDREDQSIERYWDELDCILRRTRALLERPVYPHCLFEDAPDAQRKRAAGG